MFDPSELRLKSKIEKERGEVWQANTGLTTSIELSRSISFREGVNLILEAQRKVFELAELLLALYIYINAHAHAKTGQTAGVNCLNIF